MSSTAFAAVLAFAAGLGGAVRIALRGRLEARAERVEAVTWKRFVGITLLVGGAALTLRR